jgi:hypothetical protein
MRITRSQRGRPFEKCDLNSDINTLLNADPQKKHVVTRDQRFKGIQTLVAKAAIPAAKVCQLIMSGQDNKQAIVDACLDSITVLSNANSQTNQMRRDNLRPYINSKISGLVCKQRKENDLDAELFPKMQESAQAAKQGIGLLNQSRGRGRGRGGGYRPYPARGYRGFRGPYRGQRGRYDSYYSVSHVPITHVPLVPLIPTETPIFMDSDPYRTPAIDNFVSDTDDILRLSETNVSHSNEFLTVDCSREGSVSASQPEWSTPRQGIRRPGTREPERTVVEPHAEVSSYVATFESKWDTFQACRVKQCLSSWRSITSDPWILKNLYGYKLELTSTPVQDRPIPEIRFNVREKDIMRQEVYKCFG